MCALQQSIECQHYIKANHCWLTIRQDSTEMAWEGGRGGEGGNHPNIRGCQNFSHPHNYHKPEVNGNVVKPLNFWPRSQFMALVKVKMEKRMTKYWPITAQGTQKGPRETNKATHVFVVIGAKFVIFNGNDIHLCMWNDSGAGLWRWQGTSRPCRGFGNNRLQSTVSQEGDAQRLRKHDLGEW